MKWQKFTLLELLVVIAVMMILSSILLPSLNKAKMKAKEIGCASNLKQLGVAAFQYGDDFNGYIPPAYAYIPEPANNVPYAFSYAFVFNNYIPYPRLSGNYLPTPSDDPGMWNNILYCPASKVISGTGYRTSYAANVRLMYSEDEKTATHYFLITRWNKFSNAAAWIPNAPPSNIASSPSNRGLLMDGAIMFRMTHPFYVRATHARAMNVLFVDGHVGISSKVPAGVYLDSNGSTTIDTMPLRDWMWNYIW